jgi:hypothetical protein
MTEQIENPASSLLDFIERTRRVAGQETQRKGWSIVLDVKQDDDVKILDGIADTIKLIARTKKAVDSLEDGYEKGLFLNPIDNVLIRVRNVNLNAPWSHVTDSFDDRVIQGLQFCATVLKMNLTQKSLNTNQVEEWMKEIDTLLTDIIESEVPQELKSFFVEHLEKLRRVLLNYWLFGIEGVRTQLEESIGAGLLRLSEIRDCHSSGVIRKIIALVSNVADAITVAQGMKALTVGALNLILPGS